MAYCLMAPSHYLNQFLLILSEVFWYSPLGNQIEMVEMSTFGIILKITNLKLQPHFEEQKN